MYPDEVDINDPPIIVKRMKKRDASKLEEYVEIPEVEIEDVIAKKTLKIPSLRIIKN